MRLSGWAFWALAGILGFGLFFYVSDRGRDLTISSPQPTQAAASVAPATSCHAVPSPAPISPPPSSPGPSSVPVVTSCMWAFERYVSSPYELEWEGTTRVHSLTYRLAHFFNFSPFLWSEANITTWKDGPCAAARTEEQKAKSKLWMEYANAINQRSWNDVELLSRRKEISAILSYFVYRRPCDGAEYRM